jgi:hypothetical protein
MIMTRYDDDDDDDERCNNAHHLNLDKEINGEPIPCNNKPTCNTNEILH